MSNSIAVGYGIFFALLLLVVFVVAAGIGWGIGHFLF